METKCRFLIEYKNFRVRKIKEDLAFRKEYPATNNHDYEIDVIAWYEDQIEKIEKYYSAARKGLLTVDECMYKIASIGNYFE
jgi:hypothetical protein